MKNIKRFFWFAAFLCLLSKHDFGQGINTTQSSLSNIRGADLATSSTVVQAPKSVKRVGPNKSDSINIYRTAEELPKPTGWGKPADNQLRLNTNVPAKPTDEGNGKH